MTMRRTLPCALALLAACAPARAAQPEPEAKRAATTGAADAAPHAEAGHDVADAHDAHHDDDHAPLHGQASGCPVCPPGPAASPAELAVMMTLRERHARAAARELELQRRETAVGALEQELDARVAKLDAAMNKLEERLNLGEPGRAAREKRVDTLVETLGGLSVKKAAPILAEAEPEVAAELLRRVGAARAAALLTVMSPAKAGHFISLGIAVSPAKEGTAPTPPEASP